VSKFRYLRIFVAAAMPFLVGLWLSVTALQPRERIIEGQARTTSVCPVTCADLLTVGTVALACKHDFSGYPHSCRSRQLVNGQVKVTYVPLPSVASALGISPSAGVVTQIEKEGNVVFQKSASSHVWAALYGGWVFHAIYWPTIFLVGRFWPALPLARKRRKGAPSEA
jgi:hypothetical protein